jgi:hydroxyacyl-ACP dehydratase HTD2-like protein with hotdog domain
MSDEPPSMALLAAAGLPPDLTEIAYCPSRLQLFRFSAVTWNAHRIHYDETYARSEGHDGLVVQSTLRGQQLLSVLHRWLGERGQVTAFAWRNVHPAYADQPVVCRGRVLGVAIADDGSTVVNVELVEMDRDGREGAVGTATARLRGSTSEK